MSLIIGFTGLLGSGKDTAADRFATHLSRNDLVVQRGSFARKLKQSATACWGEQFDVSEWESWKNNPRVKVLIVQEQKQDFEAVEYGGEEKFPADVLAEVTVRQFLQYYGTEAHRHVFGLDFWVDQAFQEHTLFDVLIFSDCRFENEARSILDRGGVVVKVEGQNEAADAHVSEAGLPDWMISYHIDNRVRGDEHANLDKELFGLASQLNLFLPYRMAI